MGALPSQKYDMVLLAFIKWYNSEQMCVEDEIAEELVVEFLRKCDEREIEI